MTRRRRRSVCGTDTAQEVFNDLLFNTLGVLLLLLLVSMALVGVPDVSAERYEAVVREKVRAEGDLAVTQGHLEIITNQRDEARAEASALRPRPIDAIVVCDGTVSMSPVLAELCTALKSAAEVGSRLSPRFRLGVVVYRDAGSTDTFPLTEIGLKVDGQESAGMTALRNFVDRRDVAVPVHAFQPGSERGTPTGESVVLSRMVAAFIGGLLVLRAFAAIDLRHDHGRIDEQRRESATTHGRARFADAADIKRFGLDTGKGSLVGHFKINKRRGVDLWYDSERSAITLAPPGAGKGVSGSILQLLTNAGSMAVNDPKGDLYLVTGDYRRDVLGHDVILISPHHAMLGAELGVAFNDTRYNPLSVVRDGGQLKDDIEMVASMMLPCPGHSHPQAEFFAISGQTWLIAGCLDLKRRNQPLTLPALSAWLRAHPQAFEKQLSEMMKSDALNGLVSQIGGKLLGTLANAPEEAQGGLSSAQNATRIYDGWGPLGKHVSGDDFNPATIKRRPTTVYICLPSDYIVTHAPWANLVFCTLFEAIGRDRTHSRVTFLLDEFANLGYMPNLLRAVALYRQQGIRVHAYLQQASQMDIYGPQGWRTLAGMCDFIQSFGVSDYQTTKMLSEICGQMTVEDVSQNLRPSALGGMSAADLSYGQSRTGRVLLAPDDIRTMPSNQQLILYRNMAPLIAEKIDYRDRPNLRAVARPNPYYARATPKS